jgi:oxygen-independent coproporphyrinogen-3 oxidase
MNARIARGITGLYVHVPFCDGKCAYCAFYSVPFDRSLADRYLCALDHELARRVSKFGRLRPRTIYFGGGTPTLLSADQTDRLCRVVRSRVSTNELKEWTVEANPGTVTAEELRVLAAHGVNRISIGAQSFDADALARLGRRHSVPDIREAVRRAAGAGFGNIGLDLIAAVPGVDMAGWKDTLRRAVALQPAHVSVYSLTVEEGTKLIRQARAGCFRALGEAAELAFLLTAEQALSRAGYRRYEISNYARPGFECRHNLACWRGEEYLGLGAAAASHVGGRRWTNAPDVAAYIAAAGRGRLPPADRETLTPLLRATERLVFGLRMAEGVDLEDICGEAGLRGSPDERRWVSILERFERIGLVTRRCTHWSLSPAGRNVADGIARELMP